MRIAVIGAGVMGRSIASHIASCDHQVLLLDIVDPKQTDRNYVVQNAIDSLKSNNRSLISHPDKIKNIKIGNLEDDIALLGDCDLVIEAIVEKLEVKLDLYKKIAKFLNPNCILASNTSTLSLNLLKSSKIWPKTLILHFFNPVRYLSLVELVTDSDVPKSKVDKITAFLTHALGRDVVPCNDSPGFIANRVGCFFLEAALQKAIKSKLNLSKLDLIAHKLLGMPRTGIFGLYDLIGLDVMHLIGASLTKFLPKDDKYQKVYFKESLVSQLIAKGQIGSKSGSGFYKKVDKNRLVLNLASMEYEAANLNVEFGSIDEFRKSKDPYAQYFRELIEEVYNYGINLVPEVTNSIKSIDKVLKIGFNWSGGLSGLAQNMGIIPTPKVSTARKKDGDIVANNADASISTYKEGLVFTIESKMGVLTHQIFDLLNKAIDLAEKQQKVLIVKSGRHFSVGGNLKYFLEHAKNKNWSEVERFLQLGQNSMQRFKSITSVSIAQNYALGGGCEFLLNSNRVIAGLELQGGLVESTIGLIPAWGGFKEMTLRSNGDSLLLKKHLGNIIFGNRTTSADYFKDDYSVSLLKVMHPDDRLDKALALDVRCAASSSYEIKVPNDFNLEDCFPNADEFQKLLINRMSKILKRSGLKVQDLLDAEREIFMELIKTQSTIDKISKVVG
ncbi:3-hydroxyacyl-CoA dehydrogenase [Candidatus Phycorickettsia trachydisci]|uniref:3-hydroxyacyl-CoA dehydrogenase n=1 Tax=Candidatus Phycorickettsia trachydisci TaxID=2115978 RepID=A0A2P1P7B9_9RICK|nr:3-hydroxyacyl-CoA dehydrogenase NAD-binding domain-containing protein [Candidatus Phycorickettsia trachydisci]AVP87135.1 3-hydroxyacyl-CoA dehydrogenase [Candidatus Phycorickettsia trachydisci]